MLKLKIISCLLFFLSASALADYNKNLTCAPSQGDWVVENIGFGDVSVSPTAQVGDVIATTFSSSSAGNIKCYSGPSAGGGSNVFFISLMANDSNKQVLGNVFSSGIPGIGVRGYRSDTGVLLPTTQTFTIGSRDPARLWNLPVMKFELIKTGSIASGTLNASDMFVSFGLGYYVNANGWFRIARFYRFNNGGTNIITAGCTVKTLSQNVSLGEMSTADFKGTGSTGPEKAFQINFNCPSAVDYSFSIAPGAAGSHNDNSGILNIASGSLAASGVGIQVLQNSSPVPLNSTVSAGKTNAGTDTILNLSARYIQTAGTITGGQADSSAVVTINYN